MITFKELRWSNVFSYGPNNVLRFDEAILTQLVGKNGFGKSSIGLILEEVLFNTNSKKIKKSDVLNRYAKDKHYTIELDFDKDDVAYTIKTRRTSSSGTVQLLCNEVDISGHTATTTYKLIEEILGYDHKTFGQIVYQSSAASLEFLTATDTSRKAFLIDLLKLTKYTSAGDVFKKLASDTDKKVAAVEGQLNTVNAWLAKMAREDLSMLLPVEVPEQPTGQRAESARLGLAIQHLDANNKRITTNNTYIKLLNAIVLEPYEGEKPSMGAVVELQVAISKDKAEIARLSSTVSKDKAKVLKCPTCSQDIDNSINFERAIKVGETLVVLKEAVAANEAKLKVLQDNITRHAKSMAKAAEWEKYSALVDTSLPTALESEESLRSQLNAVESEISKALLEISKAEKWNKEVAAKNAKVTVLLEQQESMLTDQQGYTAQLAEASKEASLLQVLSRAFSSTGLVAYKLECLVKDLEDITNEYLADLAGGRFQLGFKITASDKLNVVITDNGRDIEITALSSGERARVNVAALLAIRKLMQTLSNSRTNLLILDETAEALDAEGKEKLIEVLLEEENLNTFLVSHGYSHPLLEKLNVVKDNNISRIE